MNILYIMKAKMLELIKCSNSHSPHNFRSSYEHLIHHQIYYQIEDFNAHQLVIQVLPITVSIESRITSKF